MSGPSSWPAPEEGDRRPDGALDWSPPSADWAPAPGEPDTGGEPAPTGPPALVPRPWLTLAVAVCVAALVGAGWVGWYQASSGWLVRVAGPGGAAQVEGNRYRLTELWSADALASTQPGEQPQPAPPGTVLVVARMEVDTRQAAVVDTADGPLPAWCQPVLLGAGRMVWEPQAPVVERPHPAGCEGPGEQTVEVVYQVPERQRDQIRGVLVRPSLGPGAGVLLRPPG